jgi:hypothetical protein
MPEKEKPPAMPVDIYWQTVCFQLLQFHYADPVKQCSIV